MRIKYTTYDTRRDEDIVHLDTTQCNVMFLDPAFKYGSPGHPFKYGKVIAILHADVGYVGDQDLGRRGTGYAFHPIEFLWIRWYEVKPSTNDFELDKAVLLPIDAPGAHAIVDPLQVLRACHIIPNFNDGRRYQDGKGKSVVGDDGSDWSGYFINRLEGSTSACHRDLQVRIDSWIETCL